MFLSHQTKTPSSNFSLTTEATGTEIRLTIRLKVSQPIHWVTSSFTFQLTLLVWENLSWQLLGSAEPRQPLTSGVISQWFLVYCRQQTRFLTLSYLIISHICLEDHFFVSSIQQTDLGALMFLQNPGILTKFGYFSNCSHKITTGRKWEDKMEESSSQVLPIYGSTTKWRASNLHIVKESED